MIRPYASPPCASPDEVKALAEQLVNFEDKVAESEILHLVGVKKTIDEDDSAVVPFSFEFKSLHQLSKATSYWQARLITIQLYLRLLDLPSIAESLTSFRSEELIKESMRIMTNIFMCFQWTRIDGMFARRCLAEPLIVCWGACKNTQSWRDMSVSALREWILQGFNDCIAGWKFTLAHDDLDSACDLYAGGPLIGFVARGYSE